MCINTVYQEFLVRPLALHISFNPLKSLSFFKQKLC